jgi:hypothetical protein
MIIWFGNYESRESAYAFDGNTIDDIAFNKLIYH